MKKKSWKIHRWIFVGGTVLLAVLLVVLLLGLGHAFAQAPSVPVGQDSHCAYVNGTILDDQSVIVGDSFGFQLFSSWANAGYATCPFSVTVSGMSPLMYVDEFSTDLDRGSCNLPPVWTLVCNKPVTDSNIHWMDVILMPHKTGVVTLTVSAPTANYFWQARITILPRGATPTATPILVPTPTPILVPTATPRARVLLPVVNNAQAAIASGQVSSTIMLTQ